MIYIIITLYLMIGVFNLGSEYGNYKTFNKNIFLGILGVLLYLLIVPILSIINIVEKIYKYLHLKMWYLYFFYFDKYYKHMNKNDLERVSPDNWIQKIIIRKILKKL